MREVARKLNCNCVFSQVLGSYKVTPWDIFPEKLGQFETVVYDARTNTGGLEHTTARVYDRDKEAGRKSF
jgi:hypothetical protein